MIIRYKCPLGGKMFWRLGLIGRGRLPADSSHDDPGHGWNATTTMNWTKLSPFDREPTH